MLAQCLAGLEIACWMHPYSQRLFFNSSQCYTYIFHVSNQKGSVIRTKCQNVHLAKIGPQGWNVFHALFSCYKAALNGSPSCETCGVLLTRIRYQWLTDRRSSFNISCCLSGSCGIHQSRTEHCERTRHQPQLSGSLGPLAGPAWTATTATAAQKSPMEEVLRRTTLTSTRRQRWRRQSRRCASMSERSFFAFSVTWRHQSQLPGHCLHRPSFISAACFPAGALRRLQRAAAQGTPGGGHQRRSWRAVHQ